MVDDLHRPEQAEAEIARQEAIRQQELERRLAEAETATEVEAGQATTDVIRTDVDAVRAQLGEQVSVRTVDVEVHIREVERSETLELEKATLSQRDVAPPTDQQVQEGAEALRDIEELRPEIWRGLDDAQRLDALREVEGRMAEIQGRPPVEIRAEKMEPHAAGYYSQADRIIRVNADHLRNNDNREVLDTVVHEGRHAYQHYAVEHPGFHSNQAEVEAWEWNLKPENYIDPRYDPEGYLQQPVEADAYSYAGRVVRNAIGG